ncbi:lipopolysaccharide biosynthesis protein [Plantibacter sp. CFBP 13570]|uniref:lipopolysaccharide biosynthesis protein n=1 Tax=Plantibacter sp. CFBP 13570 TaxID=2775272 RepID=UPI001930CC64|nr:lipopolysaccharide biosynthesis protein [Plantibacter sp. CFBP 13570]MBD8535934.1 lipopolysaccharide biosynthesis protein [Plantibacter sp. CFBP 13570]
MREASVNRGIISNLSAGSVLIGVNLAAIPVSILIAGASDYGAWAVSYGLITLLVQTDLGLASGLVRQLAHARHKDGAEEEGRLATAGLLLFIALAVTLGLLSLFVLPIYYSMAVDPIPHELAQQMTLTAAASVVVGLAGRYYIAIAQSYGQFGTERLAAVIGQIARLAILLVAVAASGNIFVVLIADLIGLTLLPLVLAPILYIRRYLSRPRIADRALGDSGRSLVRFSIPTFISSFSTLGAIQAPLYIVGAILGFSQAAGFSAIMRLYQSARTMTGWITGPSLPAASKASARSDREALRSLHWDSLSTSYLFALVIAAPLPFVAQKVLTLWLGEGFSDQSMALMLVGLTILINSVYAPGVVVATGAGRPGIVAGNNVIVLVLTVALSWLGATLAGVTGGAAGLLLGTALVFPFSQVRTTRVTGLKMTRVYLLLAPLTAISLVPGWVLSFTPLDRAPTVSVAASYGLTGIIICALALLLRRRAKAWVLKTP